MRSALRFLTSKFTIIALLIILQIIFFIDVLVYFSTMFPTINIILELFSILIAIFVVNKPQNTSYKLAWILLILGFPLVGGVAYLIFGNKRVAKGLLKQTLISYQNANEIFTNDHKPLYRLKEIDPHIAGEFEYLCNLGICPTYDNTTCKYYGIGETMFEDILTDLRSATEFIFIEYFIIDEGFMWDSVLEILKEKVKEGVEVRLLYDDFGCISTLPHKYDERLKKFGINVKVFNRLSPVIMVQMNNRDHRKIIVVDGKVGYTGGINLADEYINKIVRFGHWKDGGIRLEGDAVYNLTVMFLQMFNLGFKNDQEVFKYKYEHPRIYNDGIVCPFGDSPTDDERVGQNVHLNLINNSLKYLYIMTPYLILDQEMANALGLAAKRGVDVRIITPFIPDKVYANLLTKANYKKLINDGVSIYEYTPGFMHHKVMLSDDKVAFVGTINMDFRSYFLHFECGVLMYNNKCLKTIDQDFSETFAVSKLVTAEDLKKVNIFVRMAQSILNIFAPLM